MEKLNQLGLAILIICIFGLNSCSSSKKNAGYYSFEVKCIGSNFKGNQTVKAWGNGLDKTKALEQAKKNAIDEILFKGIRQGTADCNTKPIISEINGRSKFRNYFNSFYSQDYSSFVILNTKNRIEKIKTDQGYLMGAILTIKVADLKQRLFDDNILSQL